MAPGGTPAGLGALAPRVRGAGPHAPRTLDCTRHPRLHAAHVGRARPLRRGACSCDVRHPGPGCAASCNPRLPTTPPVRGPHAGALLPRPQGRGHVGRVQQQPEAAHLGVAGRRGDGVELQAAAARLPLRGPHGAAAAGRRGHWVAVAAGSGRRRGRWPRAAAACSGGRRLGVRPMRGGQPAGHGSPPFVPPCARPAHLPTHPHILQAAVYSVAFSPLHNIIASGSKDRSVRLWQPTV